MTQTFAEILLMIPMALTTGFLMFIAGVMQGVMNELDEAAFKRFMTLLYKHAVRSPYAIIVSTITWVGAIPYFIFYGFNNWWFIAGLILWTVASIVSKALNLPIYYRIFALDLHLAAKIRFRIWIRSASDTMGLGSNPSAPP